MLPAASAVFFFVVVFLGAFVVAFRRLDHGLYLMVFTAPFMEVFKASAFGVSLRANEIIPLAVFLALLIAVATGRARFRTPMSMQVLSAALLFGILCSLAVHSGADAVRVEEQPGQFSLQDPGTVGTKTLIHAAGCIVAFFAASSIGASKRVCCTAVKVMMISTVLVCIWSLLNLVGIWVGIERFGITPANVWRSSGETRIRGTLSEPSYFANYLGIMLPISFFCWIARRRLFSRNIDRFVLILLAVTLMLTFSAGGWFLLVFFAIALPLIARHYGYRLGHGTRAIAALAITGALVIGFINEFVDSRYGSMLRSGVYEKLIAPTSSGSGGMRIAMTRIGFSFFGAHPLFGIGPNMLHFRWHEHATDEERSIAQFIGPGGGSMWAYQAAELGLIGFLPIIGLFAIPIILLARSATRCRDVATRPIQVGLLAGLLACAIHYLAHETLWWPYVWIYLGLATASVRLARQTATTTATCAAASGPHSILGPQEITQWAS